MWWLWRYLAVNLAVRQPHFYLESGHESGIKCISAFLTDNSWYLKAAKADHALAQYAVATMCLEGKGTKQDYKEAFKWMKEAAEQGVTSAMYDLALMYHYGTGVKKSNKEAFKWMRFVADDLFEAEDEFEFDEGFDEAPDEIEPEPEDD